METKNEGTKKWRLKRWKCKEGEKTNIKLQKSNKLQFPNAKTERRKTLERKNEETKKSK